MFTCELKESGVACRFRIYLSRYKGSDPESSFSAYGMSCDWFEGESRDTVTVWFSFTGSLDFSLCFCLAGDDLIG